jgi:hypothetical protein
MLHPATLAAGVGPDLLNGMPEAKCAVGDRELGAHSQPATPQIEEQLPPGLRALANAVDQPDEFFLPSGVAPTMTTRHCAASSSLAHTESCSDRSKLAG